MSFRAMAAHAHCSPAPMHAFVTLHMRMSYDLGDYTMC